MKVGAPSHSELTMRTEQCQIRHENTDHPSASYSELQTAEKLLFLILWLFCSVSLNCVSTCDTYFHQLWFQITHHPLLPFSDMKGVSDPSDLNTMWGNELSSGFLNDDYYYSLLITVHISELKWHVHDGGREEERLTWCPFWRTETRLTPKSGVEYKQIFKNKTIKKSVVKKKRKISRSQVKERMGGQTWRSGEPSATFAVGCGVLKTQRHVW